MQRLAPLVLTSLIAAISPLCIGVHHAEARQQNAAGADRLSDADLEELLAPVALYPDPLLANVLTAACYPDELAQAAKGGDSSKWEPSVQAIAKIPEALKMMTDYPEWTQALGEAFILQSADVMRAVQNLRARAYDNGALQTSGQMVVQQEGDVIIIEPAQPDIIYVPSYEPDIVYVDHHHDEVAAGLIGFGVGITAGLIIANNVDCDWWGGGCCYGCGHGHWHGHGDVDIDIDIKDNTINNIRNNGNKWKANQNKISDNMRNGRGDALNNYRGVGSGRGNNARVPGRKAGANPIASRPAPRPGQTPANRARATPNQGTPNRAATNRTPTKPTAQPMNRPSNMQRPATPKAKPSIPPASKRPPAARPTSGSNRAGATPPGGNRAGGAPQPQRRSAYQNGGNRQSAQRGASSRGSRSSVSRGGGGSRGGGSRGGGSRGGGGRGGGGRR